MKRLLAALLLVGLSLPVGAQQTMGEVALRQHMIAAEGKPPDQYVVETHSTSSNGDYIERDFHRGLDYRAAIEEGPFQTEHGRLEGREWDRNENGLTTIHEPASGRERPMPLKVTVERVSQPFDAWRLARIDPAGFGTVRYVDLKTYRLRRFEVLTRYGAIRTDYDDFRTVDGYTMAYHRVTENEVNKLKIDARVTSFDVRDVADADLAIPPSKPFVAFPPGKASVNVPTRMLYGSIIASVTVGNRVLDFVLDSGASGIFMDENVAREFGLKTHAKFSTVTAGRYEASLTIVPSMRVGDLKMSDVAVVTIPFEVEFGKFAEQKTKLVGLIGYDFFRSIGLTIDYYHGRVTAFPVGALELPEMTAESDILPIRLENHVPEVSATINGAVAEHMIVDTGSNSDLLLFNYFTMRYPEVLNPRVARHLNNLPYIPQGVGGGFEAKAFRLQQVDVGKYHLRDYDALNVTSQDRFQFNEDGLIGYGILQHFTVGFDHASGKLYLMHRIGQ